MGRLANHMCAKAVVKGSQGELTFSPRVHTVFCVLGVVDRHCDCALVPVISQIIQDAKHSQ